MGSLEEAADTLPVYGEQPDDDQDDSDGSDYGSALNLIPVLHLDSFIKEA